MAALTAQAPNPDATAQAAWRARDTWSLRFLRDSFPDDAVLCCDKACAPARAPLTLRLRFP
jgi:hypothetical protein